MARIGRKRNGRFGEVKRRSAFLLQRARQCCVARWLPDTGLVRNAPGRGDQRITACAGNVYVHSRAPAGHQAGSADTALRFGRQPRANSLYGGPAVSLAYWV